MATPTAIKRLTQDFRRLKKDPVPYIEAAPLESNILEWYIKLSELYDYRFPS